MPYVPGFFFIFSPKRKRDPVSQTTWCGIAARATTLSMCHFCKQGHLHIQIGTTELNLKESSNYTKNPIKANNWHKSLVTFYTQASKEKVIFILPFFLQTEQFVMVFPTSPQESQPKMRQRTDTRHYQVISWTFSTRRCSSYIQDPKGLPSSVQWSSPQDTIVQIFGGNNDYLPQIFPSYAWVRDRAHSAWPGILKQKYQFLSSWPLSLEQATTLCLIKCFARQTKSITGWQWHRNHPQPKSCINMSLHTWTSKEPDPAHTSSSSSLQEENSAKAWQIQLTGEERHGQEQTCLFVQLFLH